jgi:hypothetical protein
VNPFREVTLQLPDALFGGDPRGLLQHLGLNGRRLGDGQWAVWPNDDRTFVIRRNLADETQLPADLDPLNHLPDPGIALDDPETLQQLRELQEHLAERMAGGDAGADLAAPFHQIQSDVLRSTTGQELVNVVRQAFDSIRFRRLEKTGELVFRDAGVTLVNATDLLIRRAKLPAILFRFDQDPDVMKNMSALDDTEVGHFASSAYWYKEVIGITHYLGPLLGCLTPRFWCLPAGRPPFTILFSLGRDVAGLRRAPMEPLQLLPNLGRMEPTPPVAITAESCRHATIWWVNRLNQMFGYLCDPTTFGDAAGFYDPYEHQHWLLTFGQVFGLTTGLQTSVRDYSVQRALMNTLLDTYADRILRRDFEQLCTYSFAKTTTDRLRERMPEDVASVLMPVADRAVESLQRVQHNFFIRQQRRDSNVVVRIPTTTKPRHVEPPRAVAVLLKVFRNATHGFGGLKPNPRNDDDLIAERLLAHHTGETPADLVFLPYLYLLDALSDPERVRENIVRRVLTRQHLTLRTESGEPSTKVNNPAPS